MGNVQPMNTEAIRSNSLARRERQKAETRQAILDAARALFVEAGVAATTMRAIALRIGYTPTAIYHHFRDKDALIAELCLADFGTLAHALHAIGTIADPLERLRQMGKAYVGFAVENPQQYRFLFLTELPQLQDATGLRQRLPEEDAFDFLRHSVAEAIAQRRLRPEHTDPNLVAQLLWSGVHGLAALWLTHQCDPVVQLQNPLLLVDAMLGGMMFGIAVPPSTSATG
jgi:AcrR family transcriptional regulator